MDDDQFCESESRSWWFVGISDTKLQSLGGFAQGKVKSENGMTILLV